MIHAPGDIDYNPLWNPIKNSIKSYRQQSLANVNIFTWSSQKKELTNKKLETFEINCKSFNYNCNVLYHYGIWNTNRIKIDLTIDHLKTIKEDYVWGCDGSDVLIIKPLSDIVDKFLGLKADLVFNAEIRFWPFDEMKNVKLIEDNISKNYKIFKYLNAGLWMGKRERCIEFFQLCKEFTKLEIHPKSEQVCIKHAYIKSFPSVKIDHECVLFQNLNLLKPEMIVIT